MEQAEMVQYEATEAMQDEATALVADGAITVKEAVKFSGLGKTTIYGLMETGQLAYVRVGRARRIPRRELIRYLAGQLIPRRTA